jgi:hypothetical protein
MRIYRVHLYTQKDGSEGFQFYSSREEADKAASRFKRERTKWQTPEPMVTETNVEPTKQGIIGYLNRYADHPKK